MVLFDIAYHAELGSQLREALFFSGLGKAVIHVSPFIVLTLCCSSKVFSSRADAFQFLEPELGMFLFVVGSLEE